MKYLFVISILCFISCSKTEPVTQVKPPDPTPVKITPPSKPDKTVFASNSIMWSLVPYTNTLIVCSGNQFTLGNSDTDNYPYYLQGMFKTADSVHIINSGEMYATVDYLGSDTANAVKPYKDTTKNNIVLVWEISNDVYYNRIEVAWSVHELYDYCNLLRIEGFKAVILSTPYRNNYYAGYATTPSGYDSTEYLQEINNIDSLVRISWQGNADGFIDLAADPRLSQYDPQYFQQDHVNFTAAGYQAIADIVYTSITGITPQ